MQLQLSFFIDYNNIIFVIRSTSDQIVQTKISLHLLD